MCRVVLRDHRVVLARLAAEDAPEAIESPGVRPAVERAGCALDVIGGQVPLAEAGGRVAVALKRPDERSAVLRHARRVAGERAGEFADRPEADGVVVAARQERGTRRRAERGDVKTVVPEALLGDPRHRRRRDGPAERRRIAEARVVDQHEQHVRRALRRRRCHVDRPVGDGRIERLPDRPAEVRVRDRQHRAVRAELSHRLAEGLLQCAHALLVALDDRPDQRARERLLDTEPLLVVEDRDDPGRPRRQVRADLVLKLLVDLVAGKSADHPARDRPDGDRREQRRREQAHRKPDAASPAHSLAAEVVAGPLHRDAAVLRMRHEDDALDRDLLVLDERDQCLEVFRRLVDVLVTGNEDVSGCLGHRGSPFDSVSVGSGSEQQDRERGSTTHDRQPRPFMQVERWSRLRDALDFWRCHKRTPITSPEFARSREGQVFRTRAAAVVAASAQARAGDRSACGGLRVAAAAVHRLTGGLGCARATRRTESTPQRRLKAGSPGAKMVRRLSDVVDGRA